MFKCGHRQVWSDKKRTFIKLKRRTVTKKHLFNLGITDVDYDMFEYVLHFHGFVYDVVMRTHRY